MNNNSFENLCKLLKNNNIEDASNLIDYMNEWDVMYDKYILELVDKYSNIYSNNSHLYYRHSLFTYNSYEVVLIYWCPYSHSRVHFHPLKGCIMKVLKGYLDIDLYDSSDYSTIQHISSKIIQDGQVEYIKGKHGIHRISNDNNCDYAISLHIYVHNK
jgi:cysteine dioxygenase